MYERLYEQKTMQQNNTHAEQQLEQQITRREQKKKIKMKVSGSSVKHLAKLRITK